MRPVFKATLPPSCAVVKKSGNINFLEPSGPLQACNRTALLFYLLHGQAVHDEGTAWPTWPWRWRDYSTLKSSNYSANNLSHIRGLDIQSVMLARTLNMILWVYNYATTWLMSLHVLKMCEICLFWNKSRWYKFALQEYVWQQQSTPSSKWLWSVFWLSVWVKMDCWSCKFRRNVFGSEN
jgi:hypothetical protein